MAFIGSAALLHLHRKRGLKIFSATLCEIDAAAKAGEVNRNLQVAGAALNKDLHSLVPEHFHDSLHVFEKGKAQELLPYQSYDHAIPLKPDSTPYLDIYTTYCIRNSWSSRSTSRRTWSMDSSDTPPLLPVLLSFSSRNLMDRSAFLLITAD